MIKNRDFSNAEAPDPAKPPPKEQHRNLDRRRELRQRYPREILLKHSLHFIILQFMVKFLKAMSSERSQVSPILSMDREDVMLKFIHF
jgi:hypothetical protein